jgi:P2 family phage contractile tail tube protein
LDIFGPKVLQGFNLFVDGRGFAGKVEELELPKLTLKTEEFRAGGMDAPVELDMGMEKLECSFTLGDFSPDIMKSFGLSHNKPVSLTFRGALGLGEGNVVPVVIRAQGMMKEQDLGTWKPGDKLQHKVSVALKYYSYEQEGETLHEIDIENMVRTVNGVDTLAQTRSAIGR